MNHGPWLFLSAFLALAGSWFGFILTPQIQLGRMQQTNTVGTAASYPLARPGLARQGQEVYRANGCQYCHSQQVGQARTVCDVVLSDAGTNPAAVVAVVLKVKPSLGEADVRRALSRLPQPILHDVGRAEADAAMKALTTNGAKAGLWILPVGPDLARGWGTRRTVAQDYLFDSPVLLGSLRAGPDLANVGVRQPDVNWHWRHLYAPRAEVKGSSMPAYRFLFEQRKAGPVPSTEALTLPKELAPPVGYEIVPKVEAKALAAYLVSLRADAPLYETPMSAAGVASTASAVNPPATSTTSPANRVSSNAPAK